MSGRGGAGGGADGDDDEAEDEEARAKRIKHVDGEEDAGGGMREGSQATGEVPVIPFNLKEDREEGYFDSSGNYVWGRDKDADADAWLEGAGTASLAAKKAADADKGSFRAQTSADRGVLKQVIAALVAPGERVADALRRLGAQRREKAAGGAAGGAAEDDAKLPPWRRKRKVAKSTATSTEGKDEAGAGGMSDFDRLTEAADKLVQSGAVVGA